MVSVTRLWLAAALAISVPTQASPISRDFLTIDPNWQDSLRQDVNPNEPWPESVRAPLILKIEVDPRVCERPQTQRTELESEFCRDVRAADWSRPPLIVGSPAPLALDSRFSPHRELKEKTEYLMAFGALAFAGLMQLPESAGGWPQDQIRTNRLAENWRGNATSLPHLDGDGAVFNYVLHPLTGSGYYTLARKNGLSPQESFIYGLLMSTLFWEYGIEAMAERPSIQDLIITPVVGAVLGELSFQLIQEIDNNGGLVLGSKILGDLTKAALSPFDTLTEITRNALKPFFGHTGAQFGFAISPPGRREFEHYSYPNRYREQGIVFRLRLLIPLQQ